MTPPKCNSEVTFNSKSKPGTAKAETSEGNEDEPFKPDHLELENPKPNTRHAHSTTAAARPDKPLTSTTRAGKQIGRIILTGATGMDRDDRDFVL